MRRVAKIVYIDPEDMEKLRDYSKQTGLSMSTAIRFLLKKELQNLESLFFKTSKNENNNNKEEGKRHEHANPQ